MRVLVTGGAGFIGSHLVASLVSDGHNVRVLDALDPQIHKSGWPEHLHADAERVHGDVRDHTAVGKALDGVDCVVYLAAAVGVGQSMYQIEHYTSVNAIGAAVSLEEASLRRDTLEKIVVASSMSIYGEGLYRCPEEDIVVAPEIRPEEQLALHRWEMGCQSCGSNLEPLPTPETKRLEPTSIYAVNKRDHEEMFLAWGRAYRVPVTALRFFNVYGRYQALSNPYTGVAAIFASRLLNGRPPVIFEDGRQSRDFIHVSDIVRGITLSLERGRGDWRAFNLGTGSPTTVAEVASALGRALDVNLEPQVRDEFRAGDIRHCFADTSSARMELDFEARVSFDEGVVDLVGWLEGQRPEDLVDHATRELAVRGLTR